MDKLLELGNDIVRLWNNYSPTYLNGVKNTLILAIIATFFGCIIGLICGVLNTIPYTHNDPMWKRVLFAVLPLAVLLILPFALRPAAPAAAAITGDADTLVIVTPHTEQIRYEFDHAFRKYYQKKYGRDVKIDWRNVGGTSDIVRYVADRFEAAFRLEYEKSGKEWNTPKPLTAVI